MAKKQTNSDQPPKFKFKMSGMDGNSFYLMGRFQKAARIAGWTQEQLDKAFTEMKSGNYDHLLQTIMKYTDWS